MPDPQTPPNERTPNQGAAPPAGTPGSETPGQTPPSDRSLFEDAGLPKPGDKGSTVWPEDWRTQMAGGDDKLAKQLERYDAPDKVGKAFLGLRQRISTGEFRTNTPKPQDAEQVKAWKTERGLPPSEQDYQFPLPNNVKLDDLDETGKARVEGFTKAFYQADLSQPQVNALVAAYNERAEADAALQAEADAGRRDDLEDALRAELGGEFRTTMAGTKRYLEETFGADRTTGLLAARMPDGTRIMDIPEIAKFWIDAARNSGRVDYTETGEVTGGKSVDQRIEEINQIFVSDSARYYSEKLDVEKQKLLERKERRG